MNVDVLILCGGLGTRLRTVIGEHQKVMADAGGRPFLDVILEDLIRQGVKRVVLCTGFDAESVENYYRRKSIGLEIVFSREKKPLGTGGAVNNARPLIKSKDFFVMNGDCFCDIDLAGMYASHKKRKKVATIAVKGIPRQNEKKDYGGVTVDKEGKIVSFKEKEASSSAQYVNAGVYCFHHEIFDYIPEHAVFSMEYDLFPSLVEMGIAAFIIEKPFYDIGTPERFAAAKERFGKNEG